MLWDIVSIAIDMKELSEFDYSKQSFSGKTTDALQFNEVVRSSDFLGNAPEITEVRPSERNKREVSFEVWNYILQEVVKTTNANYEPMKASEDGACLDLVRRGEVDQEKQVGLKMTDVLYFQLDDDDYEDFISACQLYGGYNDTEDSIFMYLGVRTRGEIAPKVEPYQLTGFTADRPAIAEIEIDIKSEKDRPCRHFVSEHEENDNLEFLVGVLDDQTIAYKYLYQEGNHTDLTEKFREKCEQYNLPDFPEWSDLEKSAEDGKIAYVSKGYMTQQQAENFLSFYKGFNYK